MKKLTINTMIVLVAVAIVTCTSGCANWEKKYNTLNVEHQNLQGRYENCMNSLDSSSAEKAKLGQALNQSQQTLEELQQQIQQRQSVDEASGFVGMDVAVDSDAGTITVTLPNTLLFAPGKASLAKSTIAELDHVKSVISQRHVGRNIDVVGHTDSTPIRASKKFWKDNWELSAQRSLEVQRYLKKRGISSDKLRAVAAVQAGPLLQTPPPAGDPRTEESRS